MIFSLAIERIFLFPVEIEHPSKPESPINLEDVRKTKQPVCLIDYSAAKGTVGVIPGT